MTSDTPVFFHGSYDPLATGLALTPQTDGYVAQASDDLETLFEQCRPEGMIARHEAVFMVDAVEDIDPSGGYTDHIYLVAPEGSVERHDLAWYSQAQAELSKGDREKAEECAHAYWRGENYPVREWSLIEYLTKSAKVLAEYDEEIETAKPPM